MRKIRIKRNNKIIFESKSYSNYENNDFIEFEFDNLTSANLENADLSNANLSYADLRSAKLSYADLSYADLYNANLYNTNLYNANLGNADLGNTDLRNANLRNADLSYADLRNANLRNANLSNADLSYAVLYNANLYNTNLYNANLSHADLENANLSHAILIDEEKIRLGYINKSKRIVYKKCKNKIVELELLKNSIVFSINNYKCRTNRVKVISIDNDKTKGLKITSDHDENFIYEVGKIVEVEDFNLMYNIECASGIHFFMNKKEAENYQ